MINWEIVSEILAVVGISTGIVAMVYGLAVL